MQKENFHHSTSIRQICQTFPLLKFVLYGKLQQCLSYDDNGMNPVRASGTRWVSHKINEIKRVFSKFGTYTNHLASLIEDSSTQTSNKAKVKGYH